MGAWQVRGTSSSICTWTGAREPAVADAYPSWPGAPAGEEGRRFAAHTAALDREEAAARSYADVAAIGERLSQPALPRDHPTRVTTDHPVSSKPAAMETATTPGALTGLAALVLDALVEWLTDRIAEMGCAG